MEIVNDTKTFTDLLEDLEFHLIVYHPYRSLVQLTGRDQPDSKKKSNLLKLDDETLQNAWFVINDIYRSELCLLHSPHILALAAIYLALGLAGPPPAHTVASTSASANSSQPPLPSIPSPMPSAHPSLPPRPGVPNPSLTLPTPLTDNGTDSNSTLKGGHTEPLTFLSTVNVSLPLILEVIQEIISLYTLWASFENVPKDFISTLNRNKLPILGVKNNVAPADERVLNILTKMRELRERDLAHPDSGRPIPIGVPSRRSGG